MQLIRNPGELSSHPGRVCVAIGMFDGVHLGHQRILAQTVEDAGRTQAISVAITFDHHPNNVVAPSRTPALIYSLDQRLAVIGSCGLGAAWLIHFDHTFSELSGGAFVETLAKGFGRIQSICIGSDFTFGHKRSGNVRLLKVLSGQYGFEVHDLAAVSWKGEVVSSTRIREAIRDGKLHDASQMLGRSYAVAGAVVPGDRLGKQLGFPTANLDVTGLTLPPTGVYAGYARTGGEARKAVANLGFRPTLGKAQSQRRFEVHLIGFHGDLYGQAVEFEFAQRLRGEEKFPSVEALRERIESDVLTAQSLLS
jgi:riboflavin kinase/FMN adenylyltransferase